MTYTAPLADMRFALREVAGLAGVAALPGYEHATDDTIDAVLEEAAKAGTVNNAVLVEGGGENEFRTPTPDERAMCPKRARRAVFQQTVAFAKTRESEMVLADHGLGPGGRRAYPH